MHIKRLLSGSLAALMVASSFNVPVVNAAAVDEPTEVVEEAKDALGDDDIIVDDALEEETEETTEVSEPEETPAVEEETPEEAAPEEAAPEEATPEVVVEEAGEQEVVGAATELTADMVTPPSLTYNGEAQTLTATVKNGETNISDKVTVSFYSGDETGTDDFTGKTPITTAKDAGNYTVVVKGNDAEDGYSGTIKKKFTVAKKDITGITVRDTYVGVAPTVTFVGLAGTDALVAGADQDYTITYTPGIDEAADEVTATVTILDSCKNYKKASDATLTDTFKVSANAEFDKGLTLVSSDEDNKAEYTGSDITLPTFTYKIGETPYTPPTAADKAPVITWKYNGETVTNAKEVGEYVATITLKADATKHVAETTTTYKFNVTKKVVTASIADEAIDKGGKTAEGLDRKEIGDADDRVFALYYNRATTAAGARGTVADEVKPVVTLSEVASVLSPYGDDADYTVEYVDNNKKGTAKAIVTLSAEAAKNYTFKKEVGGIDKEFASSEVEFTITDDSALTHVDASKVTTEKATLSDTGSTAGKKYGYDPTYFKYVEEEIPAIDIDTIEVVGDRAEDEIDHITVDKILDVNRKVIYGNAGGTGDLLRASAAKVGTTPDGKKGGVIEITPNTAGAKLYEGSYTLSYAFAEKCEGEHQWTKKIRPAKFGKDSAADGSYQWECALDGVKATSPDLAAIKEIDPKETAVSGTIDRLDASDFAFTLSNGNVKENKDVDRAGAEIGYRGSAITAYGFSFKTYNAESEKIVTFTKNSRLVGDDPTKVEKFAKDIFTVSYKNNNKVGTGTVVVKFTDVIPEYAGAEFTYDFTIKTAAEDVAAPTFVASKQPYLDEDDDTTYCKYSYGTKISLATTTTDAKVYYAVSNGTAVNTSWASGADIEVIKNKIEDKTLTLYQNPIELVDTMKYGSGSESIDILAVAVKGNGFAIADIDASDSVIQPFTFDMVPAALDWGDVEYYDTSLTDASKLPKGLWISDESMNIVDGRTYNGYAHAWSKNNNIRVFFHNQLLSTSDYTYKFTNNVNAWLNLEAAEKAYDSLPSGATEDQKHDAFVKVVEARQYNQAKAPTVMITGKGEFAGGYQQKFEIKPRAIADASEEFAVITPLDGDAALVVPENGKIQKPKFTLKMIDYTASYKAKKAVYKTLSLNRDYVVNYDSVKETPGKYDITISGIGNYSYSVTRTLTVSPVGLYLNKANVTIDTKSVVFDGTDQTKNVKVSVKIGDVELTEGKDYDVEYELAKPLYLTNDSYTAFGNIGDKVYAAGKYTVKIVPHDDVDNTKDSKFLGEYQKSITISNNTATAITKASITGIGKSTDYDNPGFDISVVHAGSKLVEGKDYLVGYSFDIDDKEDGIAKSVGNAKVTVYGIGKYSGFKTYTYKITGIDVKNFIVDYDAEPNYDGTDIKPGEVLHNIKYQPDTNVELSSISPLVQGTDYYIDYNNKADYTNVGTKSFTIVGKGKFSGKKTFKYKVVPFDVNADQAKIKYNDKGFITANTAKLKFNYQEVSTNAYKYGLSFTGSPVQPTVDGVMPSNMTEAQYNTWVKQNFTFKYSNDYKKVGGVVTVTVTPKKNFKGSPVKMYYTVNKGDMAKAVITVPDRVTGAWAAVKPTVTLGGKKLSEGAKKDYTVNAYFAKDTKLTNGTGKKAVEVTRAKYTEPQKGDIIPAGTEIIVKVTGNNNYENYKEVSFRYIAKTADISKASVKIAGKYVYNGQTILLNKDDISVVLNKAVVPSQNFEIVDYTYPKTGYGTAKVRLHGVGDFGGYKDATFKIDKASMNYMVEFKYNNTDSKDAKKVLTVTGSTKTLSKNQNSFVLPKSGFTAKYVVTDPKTKKSTTTNYILKEWNTQADGKGTAYGVGAAYKSAKDAGVVDTLYAIFEVAPAKDETYTITFDQGEKTVTGNAPKDITAKRGTTYKLPAAGNMKNVGKKLVAWKDSENNLYNVGATVYNLKVDSKKVAKFTAVWAEAQYKITYKTNGGRIESTTDYYDYSATNAYKLLEPEKPGYTFTGWKLNKDTTFKFTSNKVELPKGTTGNLTLTAQYDPKTYTIDYNVKGHAAAVTDTTKYTVGATKADEVPVLKTVTVNTADAAEFTFLGWAKDADSVKPDYAAGKPAKNLIPDSTGKVKLNAVYAEKKYAITYDLDGGKSTALLPRNFTKAGMSAITLPGANDTSMVKAGYDFAGFVGADGKTVVTKITTAADTTLKATWKENTTKRSILFNYNGGTNAMTAEELKAWTADVTSQNVDSEVTLPTFDSSKITLANNTFKGWATSADGKVVYPDGGKITIGREDITLFAVWEKATWKISYVLNGGLFQSDDARPSSYQPGKKITVTDPTKKGYTFKEWTYEYYKTGTTGEKEEKKATTISNLDIIEDVTFTANWTANEYGITYALNGGDWATLTPAYTAPAKYKYDEESEVTLPDKDKVTRVGYEFVGWYKTGDADKTIISSVPTGNTATLALTAEWKKTNYSLSYSGYEATDKFVGAPAKYKLPTGFADGAENDTLYPLADRESQTFAGWTVGEKSSTNVPATTLTLTAAALDKSTSIVANWNDKTSVKLVYSNGESGSDEQTVEVEKAYVGTKLATNTFTKAGHTFAGWSLGAVGTPLTEANINSATGDPKTLKVTATWTKWTNTVKFNLNGGTGTTPTIDPFQYKADSEITESVKVKLPTADGITAPEGHTLKGWSVNPSATTPDEGLAIATGTDSATKFYLNPTKNKQVTILYAVYAEEDHATIVFDSKGGKAKDSVKVYASTAEKNIALGATTRDGYTFANWKEKDKTDATAVSSRTITNDEITGNKTITFEAQWTATDATITLVLDGGTLSADTASASGAAEADKKEWTLNSEDIHVVATKTYTIEADATTLPAAAKITKAGYTFDGWYSVDGASSSIDDDSVLTTTVAKGTTGNKFFKAKWTAFKSVVSFDLNGGKLNKGAAPIADIEIAFGDSGVVDVPAGTGLEKTGYTFDGWVLESDKDKDNPTIYKNGAVENGNLNVAGIKPVAKTGEGTSEAVAPAIQNVKLVAHWTEWTVTLSYKKDASESEAFATKTLKYTDTALPTVDTPEKAGYQFKGWKLASATDDTAVTFNDVKVTSANKGTTIYLVGIWTEDN